MLSFLKSAAKNSLIYGLGNISTKIIGFLLLPLYTSHLSTQEYGILGLLEVSSQLLVGIFGLSLTYPFFRWYWDKDFIDKRRTILFTCMVCLLCVSGVVVGSVTLFSRHLSLLLFDTPQYSILVIILSISVAMQILASLPSSLMQLQQKAVLFSAVNIIQLATSLTMTILCVAYLRLNVLGIYIAQIIGSMIYFIVLSKYIVQNMEMVFSLKILKGMLRVSLPLVFASISGILINVADRYMLKYFGQLADVGLYSLGYKIANTLYVFVVMSINLSIAPMLYKIMDDPNNKRVYSKIMTYVAFGVMICVIGISFFGRELIKVMAQNPEYWNSYKVVPFIAFAIYFGMLKDISQIGLNLTKQTKIMSFIVITISIINILLNALLIPYFQMLGAAFSALLSQLAFFLLLYTFAQKYYFIPYEWAKIIQISLVGMVIVFGGSIVQDAHLALRLSVKFLLFIAFPIILYYSNFFEVVELTRLRGAWIKWNNPLHWKKNILDLFSKLPVET